MSKKNKEMTPEQAEAKYGVNHVEVCSICLNAIKTMIYKGSGVCGERCRKIRDNDTEPFYPTRRHEKSVGRVDPSSPAKMSASSSRR